MNSLFIARNIILRAIGNKKEFIPLLILPIIAILIITWVFGSLGEESMNIGIVNLDEQGLGQDMVEHMNTQENVNIISIQEKEYEKAFKREEVDFGVVIPTNFTNSIVKGERVEIDFYEDGRSPQGESIKARINQYMLQVYSTREILMELKGMEEIIDQSQLKELMEDKGKERLTSKVKIEADIQQQNKYGRFISTIGFGIVFLMVMGLNTMGTITEDKRRLTLARMYAAPLREWEIIVGNLLGSLALCIIQLIPLIITIKYVFDIPWGGSVINLFVILLCFTVSTIGLGMGIFGVIKDKINPMMLMAIVIVPSSIIGGAFIPESMLPDFIRKVGYVVPQKWVMNAIYKVLQGGNTQSILMELGILLLFGITFSTFGIKGIKPIEE